LTCLKG